MLENVQSYISTSAQSNQTFNERYMRYIMEVQDAHLNFEITRMFGSPSIKKLIEIDREANNLHRGALRGIDK